jgi:hypothetical protein
MKELLSLSWGEFIVQNIKWSVAVILRTLPVFILCICFYFGKQCGCVNTSSQNDYSIVDDTIINTSDKSKLSEDRNENISEINTLLKRLKEKSEKSTITGN